MKSIKNSIPVLLSIFIFTSCNTANKKTGDEPSGEMDLVEIIKAANAISPEVSSVEDVFHTLDLTEASYYPILCNDPYNAVNYLNNRVVTAANLGVYVTDIVYHMYGNSTENTFLSFSASQELASRMGLESEFGATLLTELEGGKITRDSLIIAFSGLMSESKAYNTKEEMMHVHTAFLTGLYVEKLFITSSLLEQEQKNAAPDEKDIMNYKKMLVIFQNQFETLHILLTSLEKHQDELKDVFNLEELKKLAAAATRLEQKSEEILSAPEITKEEELTAMHLLITNIRNRVVSAS
ncbi:MAG: hypothetical protein WD052_02630 [Bacteroidales bacterium]